MKTVALVVALLSIVLVGVERSLPKKPIDYYITNPTDTIPKVEPYPYTMDSKWTFYDAVITPKCDGEKHYIRVDWDRQELIIIYKKDTMYVGKDHSIRARPLRYY